MDALLRPRTTTNLHLARAQHVAFTRDVAIVQNAGMLYVGCRRGNVTDWAVDSDTHRNPAEPLASCRREVGGHVRTLAVRLARRAAERDELNRAGASAWLKQHDWKSSSKRAL